MESPQDDEAAPDEDQRPTDAAAATKPLSRPSKKRTKTGCITCRKRRIKCGEERPTCKNCIKSKRDCGGYIQPLTFKQANGDIRIPGNDPGGVYHGTIGSGAPQNYYQPSYYFNNIQPLPTYNISQPYHPPYRDPRFDARQTNFSGFGFDVGYSSQPIPKSSLPGMEFSQTWVASFPQDPAHPGEEAQGRRIWPQPPPHTGPIHQFQSTQGTAPHEHVASFGQPAYGQPFYPTGNVGLSVSTDAPPGSYDSYGQIWTPTLIQTPSTAQSSHILSTTISASSERLPFDDWDYRQANDPNAHRSSYLNRSETTPMKIEHVGQKQDDESDASQTRRYSVHGFVQRPTFDTRIPTSVEEPLPPQVPPGGEYDEEYDDGYEEDEDDPYDVEMEYNEAAPVPTEQTQQELNTMLVKYAAQDNRRMRSFTTYLDTPTVLATYKPSHSASPLHDEKVGRIFCHFVSVTGPCLSVYERQAGNSPITFSNLNVPTSQKMLWTYILPSIAIHHPALLHALLALSSLHIAKIQRTSEDPSLKHFTYAVRRVGKLLGLPKRRHEVATLATILLLGFYEVMSADHSRWNLHLAGAKDLVMEFDFAGMARTTKRMRNQAKANFAQRYASSYEEHVQIAGIPETMLNDIDWEIDEDLVSQLTGFHIQYGNQWQPNFRRQEQHKDFTAKDVEDYKVKSDLRWWYCKQDVFQGMVSGDPLLMPYDQWIYCPPRGQIGKMNAAYGTMDHLCLIMARLTDFGGKDRVRKQRVVAAQGGQWRPPPGFFPPGSGPPKPPSPPKGPPQSTQADYRSSTGPNSQDPNPKPQNGFSTHPGTGNMASGPPRPSSISMPPPPSVSFHGMMPLPSEPVDMPSAYETMDANIHDPAFNRPIPAPDRKREDDLDIATAEALAEHAAIVKAFDLFAQSLGSDFQPLPPDANPPISTPFGPALQYRTYPIACIWAFYYVGRILVHRMHPHMPPAAMISIGVAAHLTKEYAQIVGRICAGLYSPQQSSLQNGILNPHLGSALMESTFFLLFSSIQYQDAAQRGWTVSKLNDIAEMTGWQTSASVAAACEVAWQKMGAAGKGPPYTPTMDRNNKDVRVRSMFGRNAVRRTTSNSSNSSSSPQQQEEPAFLSHDRVLIDRNPSSRVHWALGLLSVEEDIAKLNLGKR